MKSCQESCLITNILSLPAKDRHRKQLSKSGCLQHPLSVFHIKTTSTGAFWFLNCTDLVKASMYVADMLKQRVVAGPIAVHSMVGYTGKRQLQIPETYNAVRKQLDFNILSATQGHLGTNKRCLYIAITEVLCKLILKTFQKNKKLIFFLDKRLFHY